jgi:hypothetical protein
MSAKRSSGTRAFLSRLDECARIGRTMRTVAAPATCWMASDQAHSTFHREAARLWTRWTAMSSEKASSAPRDPRGTRLWRSPRRHQGYPRPYATSSGGSTLEGGARFGQVSAECPSQRVNQDRDDHSVGCESETRRSAAQMRVQILWWFVQCR